MVWIGVSVGLVTGLLAILVRLDRRARKDLGSVSATWISEQRAKSLER
jgi:hypothetical protein